MKKLFKIFTLLLVSFTLFGSSVSAKPLSKEGKEAQIVYNQGNHRYKDKLVNYELNGDYLNSSEKVYQMSRLKTDKNGIIMVEYSGVYQYNPVTIAQIALTYHGKFFKDGKDADKKVFLKNADALVSMQGNDGALRYDFAFNKPYLKVKYKKGWVSGMAQGQAMSVYARAYHITKDAKYLKAGQKAFQFMNTPISRGGTLTTLEDLNKKKYKKGQWFFYEEYISKPNNYTLNGYMFSLLGLYDWSKVDSESDVGQKEANRMFGLGMRSLIEVLPMYDVGGFTSYDLSGLTMEKNNHIVHNYHGVHLYQLHALHSITKDKALLRYFKEWSLYVK